MTVFPLRFREIDTSTLLFSNEAGRVFTASPQFLRRYVYAEMTPEDAAFLERHGCAASTGDDLGFLGFMTTLADRLRPRPHLDYLILIPTLRCDLACTYCQVSRAHLNASGFDWDEEMVERVVGFIKSLPASRFLKIEFQGGEPLLRPDILKRVISAAETHFDESAFVICTNLNNLGTEQLDIFENPNVSVSTSLDGPRPVHEHNRTKEGRMTDAFFLNIRRFIDRFGADRLSALPTIDPLSPPDIDGLLDAFEEIGCRSIFLRPVNHQGFARKRGTGRDDLLSRWFDYYDAVIDSMLERNSGRSTGLIEEYSLSLVLKRILQTGVDYNADLRNPNMLGHDYLVVDFDGQIYPTDEARMLSRIGHADLSLGHVGEGLDRTRIATLNSRAFNNLDPDCQHCAFQPFCGSDPIDDLSRYNRIDIPRHETYFCRRQTHLFEKAVSMLGSSSPTVRHSLEEWLGMPTLPDPIIPHHHDSA